MLSRRPGGVSSAQPAGGRGVAERRNRWRHALPLPSTGLSAPTVKVPVQQLPLFPLGDDAVGWRIVHERPNGARFVRLPIRSILNSPDRTGLGFWSLNPYVGCEFGCSYCYARTTHRHVVERGQGSGQLQMAAGDADWWTAFEHRVFVKQGADRVLARTLSPGKVGGRTIVIGTATDPYQPAERRFGLTRALLRRLASFEGLSVGLITKSPLVARDVDVLRKVHARNRVTIHISLITLDPRVIRLFEARSPLPRARLRALRGLARAGLDVGVIVAPVLPGITDDFRHLDDLMAAANAAGAHFVHPGPLRLYGSIRPALLPLIDRHYPHLSARYRAAYAGRGAAPKRYSRALLRRFHKLERKYGFPLNDGMQDRYRA